MQPGTGAGPSLAGAAAMAPAPPSPQPLDAGHGGVDLVDALLPVGPRRSRCRIQHEGLVRLLARPLRVVQQGAAVVAGVDVVAQQVVGGPGAALPRYGRWRRPSAAAARACPSRQVLKKGPGRRDGRCRGCTSVRRGMRASTDRFVGCTHHSPTSTKVEDQVRSGRHSGAGTTYMTSTPGPDMRDEGPRPGAPRHARTLSSARARAGAAARPPRSPHPPPHRRPAPRPGCPSPARTAPRARPGTRCSHGVPGAARLVPRRTAGPARLVLRGVPGPARLVLHGVPGLCGGAAQLHGHGHRPCPGGRRPGPWRGPFTSAFPASSSTVSPELTAGLFDLLPQLVGPLGPADRLCGGAAPRAITACRVGHRCALSLIWSTSALTLPRVSSGFGARRGGAGHGPSWPVRPRSRRAPPSR